MTVSKKGDTAELDVRIGARLRERRIALGSTQQQLAKMIYVTYQQAHKYERGINRVSAARLFRIAQVLKVPVTFFYDNLDTIPHKEPAERQRMLLDISKNFLLITNTRHQEAISFLVRALVEQDLKPQQVVAE